MSQCERCGVVKSKYSMVCIEHKLLCVNCAKTILLWSKLNDELNNFNSFEDY